MIRRQFKIKLSLRKNENIKQIKFGIMIQLLINEKYQSKPGELNSTSIEASFAILFPQYKNNTYRNLGDISKKL